MLRIRGSNIRVKKRGLYETYFISNLLKQEVEFIIEAPEKDVCPYCSSEKIFKRGVRKTKFGDKQLYCCKDCKKRFVLEPIKNIKGNSKLVCLAMDCYYKGLSYRDISDQFKQFYGLKISHVAIRNWILKFSKITEEYTKTLTPKTCGTWNADETMVRTKKGNRKVGVDYEYVWNVLDNKSKFLLASECSGHSRKSTDAQKVFKEACDVNKKMPNKIITDKYRGYEDGVRKTFRNWGNERKVKHVSILGRRHEVNNNAVENHHTHQKEFQKVRRGINEVQTYADGFKVFHNFVRKGVKDKLTPAERCGLEINGNRWNSLLTNAVRQKATNLTREQNLEISH